MALWILISAEVCSLAANSIFQFSICLVTRFMTCFEIMNIFTQPISKFVKLYRMFFCYLFITLIYSPTLFLPTWGCVGLNRIEQLLLEFICRTHSVLPKTIRCVSLSNIPLLYWVHFRFDLVGFYAITIAVGYLMPNPLYTYILNIYDLVWLAFMVYQPL